MSDHPLDRPASALRRWRVSAPPALSITVTADSCLIVSGGVLALVDAPRWSYLAPLALAAPVLIVYGRKAAEALGIHARDQTPQGALTALGMLGAVAGVLAAHAGRYSGLVVAIVIVLLHIGERLAWAGFNPSR